MLRSILCVACFALAGCRGAPPDAPALPPLQAYRIHPGTRNEILLCEVARGPTTVTVDVFVHRFGGALGGSLFQMACLADLAQQRGKSHFVVLGEQMLRQGTPGEPGNDMRMTVGFCDGATAADLARIGDGGARIDPSTVSSVADALEFVPQIAQYRVAAGGAGR